MPGPWTHLVSAHDLVSVLDDPNLVLLDCRHVLTDAEAGPRAFAEGHLPGALHAHVDIDLSGAIDTPAGTGRHPLPDATTFRAKCGAWGISPETQVVAYDDAGGAWAARAWWLLRHYGHGQVAVLDGGLQAALDAGAGLTDKVSAPEPTTFMGAPGRMPIVGLETLVTRVPAVPGTLVDARDAERYRGEVEPIDPVPGHIPGAVNLPFKGNVAADGRFLAPDELAARYQSVLGERDAGEVSVYCGSGVTAAHDVLAMELAGLGTPALYPGGWSQWCADGARPVATGDEGPKQVPVSEP